MSIPLVNRIQLTDPFLFLSFSLVIVYIFIFILWLIIPSIDFSFNYHKLNFVEWFWQIKFTKINQYHKFINHKLFYFIFFPSIFLLSIFLFTSFFFYRSLFYFSFYSIYILTNYLSNILDEFYFLFFNLFLNFFIFFSDFFFVFILFFLGGKWKIRGWRIEKWTNDKNSQEVYCLIDGQREIQLDMKILRRNKCMLKVFYQLSKYRLNERIKSQQKNNN